MKSYKELRMKSEPVVEDKDSAEYNDEAGMSKGQLQTACDAAKEMMSMIGDNDNLPEWVQSKITKAADYLDTARDYLKSEGDVKEEKDSRLANAGVSGFNKAKRTPSHSTKSHIVVAKDGDKIKTIRFGEQGASTAGDPKKGESDKMKAKRKSFKARHGKNIAKGKMSAAYWADKEKW
jgi:hypothetical protein